MEDEEELGHPETVGGVPDLVEVALLPPFNGFSPKAFGVVRADGLFAGGVSVRCGLLTH
ncbi:hypothetical protein GCM10017557_52000 [Streptomyces aurantiacus]|uniref:Uncharacterized protein n=1 Tax=Streptomyces aurantiacus TaxID=47760 RepID=A0A7G1P6R7_9ACTN|nr:hypothetical protein GCM10017557_52000 [Streptomyces aurantiacus]